MILILQIAIGSAFGLILAEIITLVFVKVVVDAFLGRLDGPRSAEEPTTLIMMAPDDSRRSQGDSGPFTRRRKKEEWDA